MSAWHRENPELADTPADPWWKPPPEPLSSEAAGPDLEDFEVLADALVPPVEPEPTEMERFLRHALELIQAEAEAFPDEDGLQSGRMARNALAEADRLAARLREKKRGEVA